MMDPLEKLFTFPGRDITTFDSMQRLDERLGSPHLKFRSIHVGGTNGKGSVSLKIAEGLRAAGYRVGLYTSPHIRCFRERICVNGEMIPEEIARDLLRSIFSHVDQELSFFDLLTALAFLYFAQMKVDWAVIEVGLGGRLDATNVIRPDLAVITSIGWDHMRLLGSTLEAIAREKGGIVKKGIPLIAGPKAAPFFPYGDPVLPCSAPFYDAENSAIAQAVLQRLGLAASSIAHGIACRPSCRFQILGSTILDVAHNVSGFERLIEALQFHFPKEKFHFIVAFSKDKEWEKCLQLIEPHAAHISLIGGLNPRLAPLGRLALTEVLGTRKEREVICGSFYLMAEALEILGASLNLS